ncbi:MAG TPA: type II toxin-antitoxin system VapC family toxin [Coxiellaceae bacterium]|nr:type II toxin-antitoxin system VapC family toxin [Coxiellaceae bacterium]
MNYLLDTNIISELTKPKPNENLKHWLKEQNNDNLYLSVITLGELQQGIKGISGTKRSYLEHWLEIEVREWFEGKIICIDEKVMDAWSTLVVESKNSGRVIAAMDSLIAATAIAYKLQLVTRNEKDFKNMVNFVNPFN